MLQFKHILKSILKYKTSSGLTLLSLVISFTGIIILTLYVSFEKSFDGFHKNADSVYRLELRDKSSWLPAKMSTVIKQNIPEVKAITRLTSRNDYVTTPELNETNTKFIANYYFADSTFFEMFSFPLVIGDKASVLNGSHSAVISETLSHKLFGDKNPVGQNILAENIAYKITGVMKDFPKNSSIQADCVMTFAVYTTEEQYSYFDSWSEWSFNNVMLLQPGSDPSAVACKIEKLAEIEEHINQQKAEYKGTDTFIYLRPLKNLHFYNDGFLSGYTNPVILKVLILLIFILAIMGAVNFINFSTSQAPLRAKALSVARVLGGKRIFSMGQIITESVLLSLLAMLISLGIYWLSYRFIESLFAIQGLAISGRYIFLLFFGLFALLFGIIAGLYPSKYITSPPIAQTVKGNIHFSGKGKIFRNTLIITQFVCTIALIASSLVIEKQLNFWRNFDIGINKDHVVYLSTSAELRKHYQAFADELMKNNNISDYTYTQFIPGSVQMAWSIEADEQYISFNCWPIDDRFLDFFGIRIDKGRKFLPGDKSDIGNFILNEKAVDEFGWNNPLERKIEGFEGTAPIVGVTKNFNFSSLKSEVPALVFWRIDDRKNQLLLRLLPGNYTQVMEFIKNTAHKFDSKNQFEVKFLDDALNELYSKEERIARFIEFVALWAILLSIAGLLGLVIFISRDRIKEIGIRKVNGAKVSEVIMILNRDFVKWVAIAFVIATPIAYFAMHKWLENFAYKTELSWWIFVLAGLLALGIALLTVSWQSWRAATRNPVEALRYE
jgi:putative ABC transport system permease protein